MMLELGLCFVQLQRFVDVSLHQWGQIEDTTNVDQTVEQVEIRFLLTPVAV